MDITDDTLHATLLHICKGGHAPDYVLDTPPLSKEAAAQLSDHMFADRINRRYPINSKANTWLSAAYFAKTAGADNYSSETMKNFVETSIKLAADTYGIREDVDAVMATLRAKPIEKKASENDDNYGWPAEHKYPMFDEHGVKLACSYFKENAFNYPPEMRKEIATRIFKKCAEYGIEANDTVRQESGNGFNLREDVGIELVDRVKMASHENPEAAGALAKATSTLMTMPMSNYQANLQKFASLLDSFDEAMGFADQYGSRFRSPMEILHGRNIKEAEAFLDDSIQLGDDLFSITKLAGLPLELFTSALGDDFGSSICGHSAKAMKITKHFPGGMMQVTISGGTPEMMDGGFGFDTDFGMPKLIQLGKPCSMGSKCKGVEDVEDIEDVVDIEDDKDTKKTEETETSDEDTQEDVIDVKKLGKALKALPERDRNALRKAIELYMD